MLAEQGNLGTVEHAESTLARVAATNFSPEFLWTSTLYTNFEPCAMCSGTIYWGELDSIVNDASAAGVKLLLSVVAAPSWATPDGRNGLPAREHFSDFNYFMGQIRLLRATMDDFSLEFLNLTERNFT